MSLTMHSVKLLNKHVTMNPAITTKLNKCKCGNNHLDMNANPYPKDVRFITCNHCKSKGPEGSSVNEAIQLWNTYQLIS